jgi:hypothetical protein
LSEAREALGWRCVWVDVHCADGLPIGHQSVDQYVSIQVDTESCTNGHGASRSR